MRSWGVLVVHDSKREMMVRLSLFIGLVDVAR